LDAVVGASRPPTSDLGWMPEDRQVHIDFRKKPKEKATSDLSFFERLK
jgi:hypothetical protein